MENILTTIRNMGRVGIPCLSYLFSVSGVWGYYTDADNSDGRGGAGVKKFDLEKIPTDTPPRNREFWFNSIQSPNLFDRDLSRRSPEGYLPPVRKYCKRCHMASSFT